jgi:hypothetical protein
MLSLLTTKSQLWGKFVSLDTFSVKRGVAIDNDAIEANARLVGAAIVNNFIEEHAIFTEAFNGMRPAKMLVFLVIVSATIQRFIRKPVPEEFHGYQPLDESVFGHISRRAIAESSRIPRENVRRIVKELLAEGRIVEGTHGGLRNERGLLISNEGRIGMQKIVRQLAHTSMQLQELGVIRPSGGDVPVANKDL